MPVPLRKQLAAEALGTFALVFAGTGAAVVHASGGAVTHVGVALTFGLTVFALVATFGDVSGAHLNPAVTTGFALAGRFPARNVLPFVAAQCLGAVAASVAVLLVLPESPGLGGTAPAGSVAQSWVLELILTAGLMFVVLSVSTGAAEKGITAGLAVGATVGLMALFAGPVSGASMNPARSLGPAVVAWQFGALWVYLTAPAAGAALAVPLCRCVREEGCCPGLREGPA